MGVHRPKITFVNHASFIFEYRDVRLICDPWLEGTAFNHGWRLLSRTRFRPEDFGSISHLWFSHQHPDHFSPRDIRAIAPALRRNINVLYQHTRDKKVVRFCKALKFRSAVELRDRKWTTIAPDVQLMCGTWDDRDSWLAIRTPDTTILNVNDCFIETSQQAAQIAACVGPVDLLLTQFSFANWAGNPSDVEHRRNEANLKLREIRLQVDAIKPSTVLPFASFVWFSHAENFYHNADMNRVADIARWIEDSLKRSAVVLYPGDAWEVGDEHDWRPAAEKYSRDINDILNAGPKDFAPIIEPERLESAMREFLKRVKKRNPAIVFVPRLTTSAYVTDLDRGYELSLSGLRELPPGHRVDINLGSDSLHFALRAPWGANALGVNGRFTVPPGGDRERFFRFFRGADINDHGFAMDYRWAARQVLRAIARRAGIQTPAKRWR